MGSYDCYCAFCSGPLACYVTLGSRAKGALRHRKRHVKNKRRELAGEVIEERKLTGGVPPHKADGSDEQNEGGGAIQPESLPPDANGPSSGNEITEGADSHHTDSDTEMNSEPDDAANEHTSQNNESDADINLDHADWDGNEDESDFDNEHSYDPNIITKKDIKWLLNCRSLGFNPNAEGISKAYITGRGSYSDYGEFCVRESCDDPNMPENDDPSCYHSFNANQTVIYPFHEACYEIFARYLFDDPDTSKIDKDILFSAMDSLCEEYARSLELDYGSIEGPEQTWDSIAGEEYSVIDPSTRLGIVDILRNSIPVERLAKPANSSVRDTKDQNDPLAMLPYDILVLIFKHLPPDDFLALIRASRHVDGSTRNNAFWQRHIRITILSFFWELVPHFDDLFPDNFDFKRVYLWLDHLTRPRFGMKGPFLGIANRRRIWVACQQLAPAYREREPDTILDERTEEEKELLDRAMSMQVPLVMHPAPKDSKIISKLLVGSWNDIDYLPSVLEIYWNANEALSGIAVTFNDGRRFLGRDDIEEGSLRKDSIDISGNDWIAEIILHIDNVNMFGKPENPSKFYGGLDVRPTRTVFVEGVTINLRSGDSHDFGKCGSGLNQRILTPMLGKHIIGLIGHIVDDGTISRIGILECARPGEENYERPNLLGPYRLLWHPNSTSIPLDSQPSSSTFPIWHHPRQLMRGFSFPEFYQEEVPLDMIPQQALVWATDPSELKLLKRISSFWAVDGLLNDGGKGIPDPDVVGLRVEYVKDVAWGGRTRHIGSGEPTPSHDTSNNHSLESCQLPGIQGSGPWHPSYMTHFDIDGPGGEVINEVRLGVDGKAIALKTNKGRECNFGTREPNNRWETHTPGEAEFISGIVVSWGITSGWSWKMKMYSHYKVSTLTVLTMDADGI